MTFEEYCKLRGVTPEESLAKSQCSLDLVPQPDIEIPFLDLRDSLIHGKGVFALWAFKPHERIGHALDPSLHRTKLIGRYINHSHTPNCHLKRREDSGYDLHALYGTQVGDELTMDYHATELIKRGEL